MLINLNSGSLFYRGFSLWDNTFRKYTIPMLREFLISGAICSLNSDEVLIGWGERFWSRTPIKYPVWYAPDFFLEKMPYLYFAHTKKIPIRDLVFASQNQSVIFSSTDWSHFETFFHAFKQSELKKIVLYVQKQAPFSLKISSLLNNCLHYQKSHPGTSLYGFWNEKEGMIGVTPEWLLDLNEGVLRTVACAGTQESARASSMLKNPKLLKEHRIVIQGLKAALKSFGEISLGNTEVKCFSKLAHLMTPIEVRGVKKNLDELIKKVHPSPALGAFPKDAGLVFLRKYAKKVPRSRFGAPFGVLEAENHAVIHVAIRNIQWENALLTMHAGCGIVTESSLEEERNEINKKFNAIHEILGI